MLCKPNMLDRGKNIPVVTVKRAKGVAGLPPKRAMTCSRYHKKVVIDQSLFVAGDWKLS